MEAAISGPVEESAEAVERLHSVSTVTLGRKSVISHFCFCIFLFSINDCQQCVLNYVLIQHYLLALCVE
jgi:hypothetical protein